MRRRTSRVMKKRRSRTSTRKTDRRRTRNVRQLRKKRSERTNKRTKRTNNKRTNNKRRNNKRTKRRRGVNHRGGAVGRAVTKATQINNSFGPGTDGWSGDKKAWKTYWEHAGNIIDDIEYKIEDDAAAGTAGDGAGENSPEVHVLINDFNNLAQEIMNFSKAIKGKISGNLAASYRQTHGNVALNAKQGTPDSPTKRIWMYDPVLRDVLLNAPAKEFDVEDEADEADDQAELQTELTKMIRQRRVHGAAGDRIKFILETMKVSELKARANEFGVGDEAIDEADDAGDVKAELIKLIRKAIVEDEADDADDQADLQAELTKMIRQRRVHGSAGDRIKFILGTMKVSDLKARAKEFGVGDEAIDEADDAENVKAELIKLIREAIMEL